MMLGGLEPKSRLSRDRGKIWKMHSLTEINMVLYPCVFIIHFAGT